MASCWKPSRAGVPCSIPRTSGRPSKRFAKAQYLACFRRDAGRIRAYRPSLRLPALRGDTRLDCLREGYGWWRTSFRRPRTRRGHGSPGNRQYEQHSFRQSLGVRRRFGRPRGTRAARPELPAARKGQLLFQGLINLQQRFPDRISYALGKGPIAAVLFRTPDTGAADSTFTSRVAERCMQKGLLVVHTGRESIKIGPPLTISDQALLEGIDVLGEAIAEVVAE